MTYYFLPIQIIITFVLLWTLSRAFLRWKDGAISFGSLLFWFAIWSTAILTVFYPDFTTYLAKLLGIGRGADVVLYSAVVILFYLVFRLHVLLENIRHDITKLVRQIALQEKKNNRSKS